MSVTKIDEAAYAEGQNEYARGGALRGIAAMDWDDEDRAISRVLGFLDGVITSIRRIDSQLMQPPQ